MRKFGGLLTAIAVAVLLAAVAVSPSDAARKAVRGRTGNFDGSWSVSIYTTNGPCGTYRVAARIAGGRVYGGGDYSVSGHVSSNGAISVSVSNSQGTATGYGRLSGSHGGGRWRTSGGECSGSWSASRHG